MKAQGLQKKNGNVGKRKSSYKKPSYKSYKQKNTKKIKLSKRKSLYGNSSKSSNKKKGKRLASSKFGRKVSVEFFAGAIQTMVLPVLLGWGAGLV